MRCCSAIRRVGTDLVLWLAVMLIGSAAWGQVPPRPALPPNPHIGPGRIQVQGAKVSGYFVICWFLLMVALAAILRYVGERLQALEPPQRAVRWGGVAGGVVAALGAGALFAIAGSPDGKTGGMVLMGAAMIAAGVAHGRHCATRPPAEDAADDQPAAGPA